MKKLPGGELRLNQPEVASRALLTDIYNKIWPENRQGILMSEPYKVVELPGIGDASVFLLRDKIRFIIKHPQIDPGKTEFMIDKSGYVTNMKNYVGGIDRTLAENLLRSL